MCSSDLFYDEKLQVSYEGAIRFEGRDLLSVPLKRMPEIRGGRIAMIFQDPLSALDPVFTVGSQIVETIRRHDRVPGREAALRAEALLALTGIPSPGERMKSYPHELSGGMQQRVMIAMALSCRPRLLIADEPTTALDVTVQAQILDLIRELRERTGMALLFITHDLGVVNELHHDTMLADHYRGTPIRARADLHSAARPRPHPEIGRAHV